MYSADVSEPELALLGIVRTRANTIPKFREPDGEIGVLLSPERALYYGIMLPVLGRSLWLKCALLRLLFTLGRTPFRDSRNQHTEIGGLLVPRRVLCHGIMSPVLVEGLWLKAALLRQVFTPRRTPFRSRMSRREWP